MDFSFWRFQHISSRGISKTKPLPSLTETHGNFGCGNEGKLCFCCCASMFSVLGQETNTALVLLLCRLSVGSGVTAMQLRMGFVCVLENFWLALFFSKPKQKDTGVALARPCLALATFYSCIKAY